MTTSAGSSRRVGLLGPEGLETGASRGYPRGVRMWLNIQEGLGMCLCSTDTFIDLT